MYALFGCACIAVRPVDCIYETEEGVYALKDLCIGCGYCFFACPFGAPQYPQVGNYGGRGKMDKCTFCVGGLRLIILLMNSINTAKTVSQKVSYPVEMCLPKPS